jgi:hypothetical protein
MATSGNQHSRAAGSAYEIPNNRIGSHRRDHAVRIGRAGPSTLGVSFQVLGQVAGQKLFTSPEVVAGMAGLKKYLDVEKLKALTPSTPESPSPTPKPSK